MKRLLISIILVCITVIIFFSTGMNHIASNLVKAYSETTLYENAIKIVNENEQVIELLGAIAPLESSAIFEGEVKYTHQYKSLQTTVRIKGAKGKARMDITANIENNQWVYTILTVRIKKPTELKQSIEIIKLNNID
jgi:hypothetical protein